MTDTRHFDLVVVGAGINGAGVAQAAAAAGHSVLLLERRAPAAGTSSRSSKLVHGGLRYLESFEFGLVRESLLERELMLRIAPELVERKTFYIPVFKETRRGPLMIQSGLALYWLLAGGSSAAGFGRVPKRSWDQLDGLRTDGLRAVLRYSDAQTDDRLLTEAVVISACSLGAEFACPASLAEVELTEKGSVVRYRSGDTEHEVTAGVVVNAAGPWVNRVLERVTPDVSRRPISLVQGSHIVLDGDLTAGFYYVESPRDGRAVFVMPWKGQVMVGTTETAFRRRDPDAMEPLTSEKKYLCQVLQHYFPAWQGVGPADVVTAIAGLRVLPAGDGHAFHRSRETILHPDRPGGGMRLLTIYGGKLTTWRTTALKVLDTLSAALPDREAVADTAKLTLERPPADWY